MIWMERKLVIKTVIICSLIIIAIVLGIYFLYKNSNNKMNIIETNSSNTEATYENRTVSDCSFTSIKDTKIELKNTIAIEGTRTSDLYVNDVFVNKIGYEDNSNNDCEFIEPKEVGSNYFLIKFYGESDVSSVHLFSKNGEYISNFEDWRKKYNDTLNPYNNLPSINIESDGLEMIYTADDGSEEPTDISYCDLKPELTDIYKIVEKVSIKNNKLVVDSVKEVTWYQELTDQNYDIDKIVCEE